MKCNKLQVEEMKTTHRGHLNLMKLVLKSKIFKLDRKKTYYTQENIRLTSYFSDFSSETLVRRQWSNIFIVFKNQELTLKAVLRFERGNIFILESLDWHTVGAI